jgi:hypothetical protein
VKKFFKTFVKIVLIAVLSSILLIGVLRNGQVQSLLANASSSYLSQKLGVKVWINKVYITSYFRILLSDVNVYDHQDQAMITAKSIFVDVNIFQAYISEFSVNSLIIDSAFVRLVQYKEDDGLNITKLFASSDTIAIDTVQSASSSAAFRLGLGYLKIENTHFIYKIEKEDPVPVSGMDYDDLDVKNVNIEFENVHLVDDSIFGHIIQIQGEDRCGIVLRNLEADANVGPRHLLLKNTQLLTSQSHAELDLAFHYDSWYAYLDFINAVLIDANVKESKINMEDIAYFASAMEGMDNIVRVQGKVKGPIRNLKGKKLRLRYGKATSFKGDLQMSGLPDIYETFLNIKLKDFSTNIVDLKNFKLPDGKQFDQIPDEISKFGKIRLKGRFTGFYNDFVSESELYSEMGMLKTDIQFMNNTEDSIIHYHGNFEGRNFNLGAFTNMESNLGDIDFSVQVEGKGLELATLDTKVIGRIDSMDFKNNELNTIFVDATIKEKEFLGTLKIEDNLINTDFTGNIRFDSIAPYFDFIADFKNVKLAKLGLMAIDSSASLSTSFHMNFTGSQLDSIIGEIDIDKTQFYYQGKGYFMDSLHILSSRLNTGPIKKSLTISSDFLNGGIKGDYNLKQFPEALEEFFQGYVDHLEFTENVFDTLNIQNLEFDFKLANTESLSELFYPSLLIKNTVSLKGNWSTPDEQFHLNLTSDNIKLNEITYLNPIINIKSGGDVLYTDVSLEELVFKEETEDDSLRFGIDSLNLAVKFMHDSMDFIIDWENYNRAKENSGHVKGDASFAEGQIMNLAFEKSEMIINDSLWNIDGRSRFVIDSGGYYFDSLYFYSLNQSVLIDGDISNNSNSYLLLRFKEFNISIFDILLLSHGINLDGFLSGDIKLIDVMRQVNFLADLHINNFALNGEDMGIAEIKSTLNTDQSIFLNINLEKEGNKGSYKPLYLEGFYFPKEEKNQIDLELAIHNLPIDFIKVFLKDYVDNLEGKATGNIIIGGNISAPDLSGTIELARTQFRIKYLNTLYSLSGALKLDNNVLGFNEVTIFDTLGNKAVLQGGLTHKNLRDFGVDLIVHPVNFVGLNTRKGMNELFYGKAVITGDIIIKGPFDNVFLSIDAKSMQGTDINIPITTALDVSDNSFIVFTADNDSLKDEEEKQYIPELSSFSLNMNLEVTPDAKVEISLPAQLGKINAVGRGDLNMSLSRTGNFQMSGDYKISKGLFFFQIRNLLNRKFTLNEGGKISWTGDPYGGMLGMSANYQVKTSLSNLGIDQDSSYRNRVPVDCVIGLSGPIMNPKVRFNFSFPNATEEIKQYVYTKIDTTNPAEMSQQMLSLLVLNSFSFNSSTNGGNLANSVSGSSMQIVANQLSNWLSQISKDVDIGINYHPGSDLSNEEVEVALSTQLFDERVTIDGNFGYQNNQNNTSTNTSTIVGDINVEVKITKDGRLRLKAFNRTNTVDLMDNTSPYTQGVGIFYRKEFNSIRDLFKSKKRKEKEKQEELDKFESKAIKNEDLSESSE